VLGFVFALRAGAVIAPLTTLVLWRAIGPRTLILAAGGLLGLVVPAIYMLFSPTDRGGFNFDYAHDLLGAHWVAVGALTLLMLALGRTLAAQRGLSRATPPTPAPGRRDASAPAARA
jgi:arabinofuranan 3-O-arabinosyltransferase